MRVCCTRLGRSLSCRLRQRPQCLTLSTSASGADVAPRPMPERHASYFSPRYFRKEFVKSEVPVVIRGASATWPAVSWGGRRWREFSRMLKDEERISGESRFAQVEAGLHYMARAGKAEDDDAVALARSASRDNQTGMLLELDARMRKLQAEGKVPVREPAPSDSTGGDAAQSEPDFPWRMEDVPPELLEEVLQGRGDAHIEPGGTSELSRMQRVQIPLAVLWKYLFRYAHYARLRESVPRLYLAQKDIRSVSPGLLQDMWVPAYVAACLGAKGSAKRLWETERAMLGRMGGGAALLDAGASPDIVPTEQPSLSPEEQETIQGALDALPELYPTVGDTQCNLWWSPPSSFSNPHFDSGPNMLVQVYGEKYCRLWRPDVGDRHLYPVSQVGDAEWRKPNTSECADPRDVDKVRQQHPLVLEAPSFECVLRPGDAIFIPYKWWHFCSAGDGSIWSPDRIEQLYYESPRGGSKAAADALLEADDDLPVPVELSMEDSDPLEMARTKAGKEALSEEQDAWRRAQPSMSVNFWW